MLLQQTMDCETVTPTGLPFNTKIKPLYRLMLHCNTIWNFLPLSVIGSGINLYKCRRLIIGLSSGISPCISFPRGCSVALLARISMCNRVPVGFGQSIEITDISDTSQLRTESTPRDKPIVISQPLQIAALEKAPAPSTPCLLFICISGWDSLKEPTTRSTRLCRGKSRQIPVILAPVAGWSKT